MSYLIGAIPTSIWVGKWFFNKDIRQFGSGNAGATNAIRVLGARIGVPILLFDIFKGFMAVKLVSLFHVYESGTNAAINLQLVAGIMAVLGHIFPLFAGFKGGKGVATLLGVGFAVVPVPALITMGIFIISLLLSKYVSLSSMISAFLFPIIMIFVFKYHNPGLIIFSVGIFVLLIITHLKNIERLLKHEENKLPFLTKRKSVK